MLVTTIISVLLLALPSFALPAQYPRRSLAQKVLRAPVKWVTHFESIPADSDIRLEWAGGKARYQVYFIPQWPQQLEYEPVDIATETSETSMIWHTPKQEDYPEGTSFIMGVNDGSQALTGTWYDVSGLIPLVEPLEKPVHTKVRRGWLWML